MDKVQCFFLRCYISSFLSVFSSYLILLFFFFLFFSSFSCVRTCIDYVCMRVEVDFIMLC